MLYLKFINIIFIFFYLNHSFAMPIFEKSERFQPVYSKNGMVATQERHATRVGVDILKKGGNAIDAAVAVGFALAVTLPRAGNLGGGGFMMIKMNVDNNEVLALNYREKAPKSVRKELFLVEGKSDSGVMSQHLSSGVPGTVAGMLWAHKNYGSLSRKEVMAPAIALAKNGFILDYDFVDSVKSAESRLKRSRETSRVFFKNNGDLYNIGEIFIQKDLAHTLELISRYGEAGFYQGEVADKIIKDMNKHGGLISKEDLDGYHITVETAVQGSYRDYKVYSMPPPSSGGVILIEILNILEGYDISNNALNSSVNMHILSETFNNAYNDRNTLLGDPAFVDNPLQTLMSKEYAKKIRSSIDLTQHTPSIKISKITRKVQESPQTTHYSIIDQYGNAVSNTYTLNYSFGNGIIVKDTGFFMNNEMGDFTFEVGKPNGYGLVQGELNSIEPEKRPLSSMTPVIMVSPDNHEVYALGSPGGSRIITTVAQVILNIVDYELNIQSAISMPRMHSQLWPEGIMVEQGFSVDTIRILESKGHDIQTVEAMGSVQVVKSKKEMFEGGSDPRRGGLSAGL
jgi:gamma-glutamyltranspeptidase / glutathione hydrolase